MKWIVRKGHIPTKDKDERKSFEEIDLLSNDGDPDLPEELYSKGFIEWVIYPGPANNYTPLKIGVKESRNYEIFCGGFLYYHDEEFKKYSKGKGYTDEKGFPEWKEYPDKNFEHKIFFEWFKLKGKVFPKGKGTVNPKVIEKDFLRVYINITPKEFNANPPVPPPPPPPESRVP